MSKILIIAYISNIDNIEFFVKNFNNISAEIILVNNLNLDLNINTNTKIYKNLNNANINYIIKNDNSDFIMITNTNVLFSYNFTNWLQQLLLENKEKYYLANYIELNNTFEKYNILKEDCFINSLNYIKYISNIGLIDNKEKIDKFINEYNTKQYLFEYDNINDNKELIDKSYNFLLVHRNIIEKYGFYSSNHFENIQHTILNYFKNLKYINILPYVLSIFLISNKTVFTEHNKIRNIFMGNKIDEGVERERKDKKIKQLTTTNQNLEIELNNNIVQKDILQKKIDEIVNIINN